MDYANDAEHLAAIDKRLEVARGFESGFDEPNWWELDVRFLRHQLAAAEARCQRLEGILGRLVALDDDAEPGLVTWHEARVRAFREARAALKPEPEVPHDA